MYDCERSLTWVSNVDSLRKIKWKILKDELPIMVDKAETNISDKKDMHCHQCGRGKVGAT